jgi:TetR/AcrR family transcriptional regulator, cholesterol catabolism regulator
MSHTAVVQSPSNRRSRRSAELRERIFRAALDQFAEKGFAEATVEDITNTADVGKGTFFNYFPSKDHILLAFGEMQLERLRQGVDHARRTHQPYREFLHALTTRMTGEHSRNPDMIRMLLLAFLSNRDVRQEMLDMQARVLGLHAEMVQLGQERDEIRKDVDPMQVAQTIRQTVFGTLLIWSLYADSSLPARIDSAIDVLWAGLVPRNLPSGTLVVPLFM